MQWRWQGRVNGRLGWWGGGGGVAGRAEGGTVSPRRGVRGVRMGVVGAGDALYVPNKVLVALGALASTGSWLATMPVRAMSSRSRSLRTGAGMSSLVRLRAAKGSWMSLTDMTTDGRSAFFLARSLASSDFRAASFSSDCRLRSIWSLFIFKKSGLSLLSSSGS